MTLKQLKAFLVLARTLNYANAADELCLSQSALSMSIKTLEDELGGKLFKRNTRRVEMTPEGLTLVPYAKKLLANVQDMEKDLKQRFKLHRGVLNIAAMPFVTHAILPEVLQQFSVLHPNLSFSIHDIPNENIIEKVQEGIFEIGICFEPESYNTQLTFQALYQEDFLAVVPKNHPLADQTAVSWTELLNYPLISLQSPSIVRHVVEQKSEQLNILLDVKLECHQISSLSHFVASGMGITTVPRQFKNSLDLKNNCVLEISDNDVKLALGVIYKKDFPLSNVSTQFIEMLTQHHFQ